MGASYCSPTSQNPVWCGSGRVLDQNSPATKSHCFYPRFLSVQGFESEITCVGKIVQQDGDGIHQQARGGGAISLTPKPVPLYSMFVWNSALFQSLRATYLTTFFKLGCGSKFQRGSPLWSGDCTPRWLTSFACFANPVWDKVLSVFLIGLWRLSPGFMTAKNKVYDSKEQGFPSCESAHSTRGVASAWALFRSMKFSDICAAAS